MPFCPLQSLNNKSICLQRLNAKVYECKRMLKQRTSFIENCRTLDKITLFVNYLTGSFKTTITCMDWKNSTECKTLCRFQFLHVSIQIYEHNLFLEPASWLNITYAEYAMFCGDIFYATSDLNDVFIDNGMRMSSPSRFCLGWTGNLDRKQESELCM